MKLNPSIPLTDKFQSRIAAQAIVYHGFNMKLAVAELRPDIRSWRAFGARMMEVQEVRNEIGVIMDRTENDGQKFLKKMWDWLNDESEGKEQNERRQTAARILAKGYIREKDPKDAPAHKPMVIEGLEEGVGNLTGEAPVVGEKDPRKVM